MRSPAFVSLYIAVFVAVMGISMVSPLLPVYARDLGASGIWLGLTFSSFAITQVIFGPFAGKLSDRFGRKQFIIAGLLVYVVAAYLLAPGFFYDRVLEAGGDVVTAPLAPDARLTEIVLDRYATAAATLDRPS